MNEIEWTKRALKQWRKLPRPQRETVIKAIRGLVDMPNVRNVTALTDHRYDYRLRVGRYRVLFDWSASIRVVSIQEVKPRNERTY